MHCACVLSCASLFAIPCAVACQVPLSMEFFRQEYWSRLPFSTPRDLPDPEIELPSPASPTLAGRFLTTAKPELLLFSHSVVSDSLQPHGLQCARLPCPSPSPRPCVSDAIQPSCLLSSPSPPAFNLSQHQGLFYSFPIYCRLNVCVPSHIHTLKS